jgi:hypothetical protein
MRCSGKHSNQPESVWSINKPGLSFSAEPTVTTKRLNVFELWQPIHVMAR